MAKEGFLTKSNYFESREDKNAILLTDQDVLHLRWNKIQNWPDLSQIWALKYCAYILGFSNLLTNVSINQFYRAKFLLSGNKTFLGILSSLTMCGVIPCVTSTAFIKGYFSENLLTSDTGAECMMCRELKTIGSHLMIGSVLATFVSWSSNFLQAHSYKTYGVPDINLLAKSKSRKLYFDHTKKIFFKTNRQIAGVLFRNYSIQVVLCAFMLYMEQKQFHENIQPLKFSMSEINQIRISK
jgi:hypothetical protein